MNNSLSQKFNKFRTSPLIIGLAILEVIILICVSTYAWFVFAENNKVSSGIISVEPDSGLQIDFKDTTKDDYVNIWNYLEEFQFEPVTSLDGRNLFIPTTGTFNAYAGDVSPDTPSSPENPGDTQNTYLIYFDTEGTGWNTPYIECDYAWHEDYNIAMTRLNSTSTIYYYDLAPLINKYNTTLTYMKFTNGKRGNGIANITNMFGTKPTCIYPTLLANYLYKCELDSNGNAIQGEQANHYGLKVLQPEPYSGTVPDIGGSDSGNSGSGDGTGAVADKGGIKFREATVNDMNSKYINIDFTLTNTDNETKKVFLSSSSYFKYDNTSHGKALRLAFYQNDGASGATSSNRINDNTSSDNPAGDGEGADGTYMIYFNTEGAEDWNEVWIESDWTTFVDGNQNSRIKMSPVPGKEGIFYINLRSLLDKYATNANSFTYMKFHSSYEQLGNDFMTQQLSADKIKPDNMYGFKLDNDGNAQVDNSNSSIGNGLILDDPITYPYDPPEVNPDVEDDSTTEGTVDQTTVFFYNSMGWETPYAYIWQENGVDSNNSNDDKEFTAWPGVKMAKISGDIYYYTFNSKFDSILFNDGQNATYASKTIDIGNGNNVALNSNSIYTPIGTPNEEGSKKIYQVKAEPYKTNVDGYPVISPGVSAGFQRSYAPVIEIDDNVGNPTSVIPAFASSIDDFLYSEDDDAKCLFEIEPNQEISLSMIVWLEGTDPDCTGSYLGKYIDMNLVFAVEGFGEDLYTYRFLDKTKETWLVDKVTTDTGLMYNPVIQLYDEENQKGYQMSVSLDDNGKKTIWTCTAPASLIESNHIVFRRVNPLDEDEVWNYWDTDGFGADDVVNKTVTFTAFSDGAPTKNRDQTGAPEKSCGGLWGDHKTRYLTVYDGTHDHYFSNDDGVLTINYTFNNHNIEYKASRVDTCYVFVVPEQLLNSNIDVSFKRYYGYNQDFAFNSDKNSGVTFHKTLSTDKCKSNFYHIGQQKSGDNYEEYNYWGTDMLYIQAKKSVQDQFISRFIQVHFYNKGTGNDFYSYLYKDNNYAAKNDGIGYACVVPNNAVYDNYRVEICDPNNHSNVYNATEKKEILNPGEEGYIADTQINTYNYVSDNICAISNISLRIYLECSTEHCGYQNDPVLYQWTNGQNNGKKVNSTYVGPNTQQPETRYVYFSNSDTNWGSVYAYFFNNSNNTVGDYSWPGEKIDKPYEGNNYKIEIPAGATKVVFNNGGSNKTSDITLKPYEGAYYGTNGSMWVNQPLDSGLSGEYQVYYFDIDVTKYNRIRFKNKDEKKETSEFVVGTTADKNGMIFRWERDGARKRNTLWADVDHEESLHTTLYNSPDWP